MEASGTPLTPEPPQDGAPAPSTAPPAEQPTAATLEELAASSDPAATNQLLGKLVAQQEAQRAEIAQLRTEAAQREPVPVRTVDIPSEADRHAARMAEIAKHSHYCPGCGRLYDFPTECTGPTEAGHKPILVVATTELTEGDPSTHTPAPATDESQPVAA